MRRWTEMHIINKTELNLYTEFLNLSSESNRAKKKTIAYAERNIEIIFLFSRQ